MIDWEQLAGLKSDLGDGFDDLVDVFIAEVDGAMGDLDPDKDPSGMAADLHFLKGAALNLGFTDFAAHCSDGETRAGRGERVDLEPLRRSFAASRHAFLQGLESLRAA